MKKKINEWIYRLALKVIFKRIVNRNNLLTPEYLTERKWIKKDGYYFEPNVKDRDRIYIKFEEYYYRVFYSSKMTFIALESSVEWFELYYLLSHPDNGRYKIAKI